MIESQRAGQIRKAYCNTDKISTVKVATEVGLKTIKAMGYPTKTAFEKEKIEFLLNYT